MQKDLETLRQRYDVVLVDCSSVGKILLSLWKVLTVQAVFCWFGSLRYLPFVILGRLIGKRVVVIAGGYDIACVPEIRYGNMCHPTSRFLGRLLFRFTHVVLAVSKAALADARDNAHVSPSKLRLMLLGFDPAVEGKRVDVPKEELVVTVGFGNVSSIRRKGILSVAKISRLLPDIQFVIAGRSDNAAQAELEIAAGPNVTFTGYLSDQELTRLFARARVYLQPSIHEAFGCALAEAMLQECIPVVSDRGSLPEVVGAAGFYADPNDLLELATFVRRIMAGELKLSENPRQRILTEFPQEKRRRKLLQWMAEALDSGAPNSIPVSRGATTSRRATAVRKVA